LKLFEFPISNRVMVKYKMLADAVVIVHAAYVGFVVLGFAAILIGAAFNWQWIRNPWFRGIHLAAIGVVALMAIGGIVCPLTMLENYLREKGGEGRYPGDFVGYWAHRLIFFRGPPWVFTVCYVAFALLVIGLLVVAPPRLRSKREYS
jgi:ABC-type cobalamin transport system permease subunit